MPQATAHKSAHAERAAARDQRSFYGILDSVLIEDAVAFESDGAIAKPAAAAVWTWMVRDVAPDLFDPARDDTDPAAAAALNAAAPELLTRCRATLAAAQSDAETYRRLRIQVGGDEAFSRLPVVLNALKCRNLLEKAQGFGRAANGKQSDSTLAAALQAMPFNDPPVAALLMQAAIGQVTNPAQLVAIAIRIAGSANEADIERAGFGPLIDAILSHAQNQIPLVNQVGPFADIDLACRAIERFHRLVRSVNSLVEFSRSGRWARVMGAIIKLMSERIEPRLRDVVTDVNKALRRHREGADRLDSDQLLWALNGVFLLATVRESRDSLALNALFDQTWTQVGDNLEVHIQRCFDAVRANPADPVASERLGVVIKMAELRFNREYADVLRRAKETAEKRR